MATAVWQSASLPSLNARAGFEEQLRLLASAYEVLRVEVGALRRCLDSAGIVPARTLETEVQHYMSKSPRRGWERSLAGLDATAGMQTMPADAPSIPRPSRLPGSPLQSPGAHVQGYQAGQATSSRAVPPGSGNRQGAVTPTPARRPMNARTGSAGSPRPRSGSPSLSGCHSSSAAATRVPSAEALPRGRQRSSSGDADARESLARSQGRVQQEHSAAAVELHNLCMQLLEPSTKKADQQVLLKSVQNVLKSSREPPNSWPGDSTPLSTAVVAGREDLVRLLLLARANVDGRDEKEVSALHLAAYDGNASMCRVLLAGRADVDASDRHGQTPLFFAPNRETCKVLLDRRANVTALNHKGQSALHLAARAGLLEVVSWLRMKVDKRFADLKDHRGLTASVYSKKASPTAELFPASPSLSDSLSSLSPMTASIATIAEEEDRTDMRATRDLGRRHSAPVPPLALMG
eukprot:TRINITY_DN26954_c0_g1_i1.p1 TRINITY_DN26954_c0_g1~~TRINITY_DN26954_c0_g1_i1.p1  ORF type:complete len:464 (+),score=96.27 TRINITY_DN26954_c0_g1_i1:179-1570(+)